MAPSRPARRALPHPAARALAPAGRLLALAAAASLLAVPSPATAQPATAAAAATSPAGPSATSAPTAGAFTLPASPAAPPNAAGPRRSATARPADPGARACSFAAPVCVHIPAGVPGGTARAILRAAESALNGYRALGLPMPLPDAARGGTSAYDLYVVAAGAPGSPGSPGSPGASAVTVADPETEPLPFDQSAAFTLFPAPTTWGCELSFDVALHAAQALLLRFDGGAERGMLAAAASYLASIVAPCAAREAPAIDAFQAAPYRAITTFSGEAFEPSTAPGAPAGPLPAPGALTTASGAMLFPLFLEGRSGSGDPGRLVASLFSIASQRSDPASPLWQNEPDTFDAVRSTLRVARSTVDEMLLDFAVDRAFVGDRSDGAHMPSTDLYGKAGRVFFEWSVPYASLPRRLAPLHPLEPTGAAYFWVDLAGAPKDAEITFVADWELPCLFRWSLLKIDKQGAAAGRMDVATIAGNTHAERTLIVDGELAGVLIAGTNAGSLDRSAPFDPDDAPFLPHGYEITIYGKIAPAPFVDTDPH